LADKWLAILPNPFTERDADAGYRYDLSMLQVEFSLTQMLDNPVSGRVFFEEVIRQNLDVGRPDLVSLIFNRGLKRTGPRATPGRFRTRVITDGVTPSLHVDYKHATIKQYHKEGRALRTETTINDTRDFQIGKRLTNLPALREVGFCANRRLLRVQRLSHDPITGADTLAAITGPVLTDGGTRIPGLALAQARSHAPTREWMADGTTLFLGTLAGLDDERLDSPTGLPGWTGLPGGVRPALTMTGRVGEVARGLARVPCKAGEGPSLAAWLTGRSPESPRLGAWL
jgi:hypothetical protein